MSLLLCVMERGLHCTATNLNGFLLYYNKQFDDRLLDKKVAEGQSTTLCINSGPFGVI